MIEITHNQYVEFLNTTKWYAHANEYNAKEVAYLTLGLVGESGEFADEFKKAVRECGFDLSENAWNNFITDETEHKKKMIAELGDVLWYMTNMCTLFGITLEDLMIRNTYKLHTRLIEKEIIPEKDLPWPFTDPMKSKDNIRDNYFKEDMPKDGEEYVC